MNRSVIETQISLPQILQVLWRGKWKILVITVVSVFVLQSFQHLSAPENFIAKTSIKPISFQAEQKYAQLNYSRILKISAYERDNTLFVFEKYKYQPTYFEANLDQLFIETLKNPDLLTKIFKKHELLLRSNYNSDEDYDAAVQSLASRVVIRDQKNHVSNNQKEHALTFEYFDKIKWLEALKDLENVATQIVRIYIEKRLKDVLAYHADAQDQRVRHIQQKSKNLIKAYESKIQQALSILSEHAAIARTMGIEDMVITNSGSLDQFVILSNSLNSIMQDNGRSRTSTLYLLGYKTLERQIEVTRRMLGSKNYIDGLLKLEEKEKRLREAESIKNFEQIFLKTPLAKPAEFKAALMDIKSTQFEDKTKLVSTLSFSILLGLILGVFFVVILDLANNLKHQRRS